MVKWSDIRPGRPLPDPDPRYIAPDERAPEWWAERYWRMMAQAGFNTSDPNFGLFPVGASIHPGAQLPGGSFVSWDYQATPELVVDPQLGYLYGLTFGRTGDWVRTPTDPADPEFSQYIIGWQPPMGSSAGFYYRPSLRVPWSPEGPPLALEAFEIVPLTPPGGPSEAMLNMLNPNYRVLTAHPDPEQVVTAAEVYDFEDPELYTPLPEYDPEREPEDLPGWVDPEAPPEEAAAPAVPVLAGSMGSTGLFLGIMAALLFVATKGARR